jgi:hypothetical protein
MEKIYIKALELADAKLIKTALINAVALTDCTEISNLINVIFDLHKKQDELHQTITCENGTLVKKFVSYDPITDLVTYTYVHTKTKWFDSQEKADKYTKTGEYRYNEYSDKQTETHTFSGTYGHTGKSNEHTHHWYK